MSGTTVPIGFPYPTGGDLVQGVDEAIKALAEAVDDYFVGSDAAPTAAAGVNLGAAGVSRVFRRGRYGTLICTPLTTTAALAATAALLTLPVGYRPAANVYMPWMNWTTGGMILVNATTDGVLHTNNAIASGNQFYASYTFPLA